MWRDKYSKMLVIIGIIFFILILFWYFRADKISEVTQGATKPVVSKAENLEISGGSKGVFVSNAFSHNLYAHSNLAENSLKTAQLFGKLDIDSESELLLIESMKNILDLDLKVAFKSSMDKGLALNEYLSTLKNMQKKGNTALTSLNGEISFLDQNIEDAKNKSAQYEASLFVSLDNFDSISTEENLKSFKGEKERYVKNRADIGLKMALRDRLNYYLPLIEQQISYTENNMEKIIIDCI